MADWVGFLGDYYFLVKAVHIIFVIFWMAGLFMMPRFFAYHMECTPGSEEDKKWIEREARLSRIILGPAMGIAWIMGLTLVINIGLDAGGWLHAKLALVVLLSAFGDWLGRVRKSLASGDRRRSSRFFRMVNEIPSLFIILIVILVIIRPF